VPGVSHYQDLPEEWKSLWKGKISKTVPENLNADDSYHERPESWLNLAGLFAFPKVFFPANRR